METSNATYVKVWEEPERADSKYRDFMILQDDKFFLFVDHGAYRENNDMLRFHKIYRVFLVERLSKFYRCAPNPESCYSLYSLTPPLRDTGVFHIHQTMECPWEDVQSQIEWHDSIVYMKMCYKHLETITRIINLHYYQIEKDSN